MALGVTMRHLRAVAQRLEDNWDLLGVAGGPPSPVPAIDTDGVLGPLRAAMALEHLCTDPEDRLLGHLRELEPWAERLADCSDDVEVISVLSGWDTQDLGHLGKKDAWHGRKQEVVDLLAEAQDVFSKPRVTRCGQAVLAHLAVRLSVLTLGAAQARRREGRLRFHDLLVLARDLVAGDAGVQRELHDQYRYLLVDEFQDTDPIQAELAVRIASAESGRDWTALPVEPGRLFFVGDPKQSIYRFRRADVELFEDRSGALWWSGPPALTTNFRSVPAILAWVDDGSWADLLGEGYPASSPHRPAHPGPLRWWCWGGARAAPPRPRRPAWRRGRGVAGGGAGRSRRAVAGGLKTAGRPSCATSRSSSRRARPRPVPGRGVRRRRHRVPVASRARSSTHAPEVRSLLAVLRAIDDPTDELSVIAALRSPAFGCGDDDLVRHRLGRGPMGLPAARRSRRGPGGGGLAALRSLHDERWWPR